MMLCMGSLSFCCTKYILFFYIRNLQTFDITMFDIIVFSIEVI